MSQQQQSTNGDNGTSTADHTVYHNPGRYQLHNSSQPRNPRNNKNYITTECTVSGQDSVILGCGNYLADDELWVEYGDQTENGTTNGSLRHFHAAREPTLQILGVRSDGPRARQWAQSSMDPNEIEEHCPWFSALQIPYVLDHLILNHKLFNIRIKKVAAGGIHCLFLTEDGFVYGMGSNKDDQLMTYDKHHKLHRGDVSLPTLLLWFVERNIRIKDIACAGRFSAFITTDDELYTVGRFGSNSSSMPGPVKLRQTNGVISVWGVGDQHLVFQCSRNQVYSLGSNAFGQLGVRRGPDVNHAVEALVAGTSDDTQKPFNFCRLTKIDGGLAFTIVLTSQFDVYAAGSTRSTSTSDVFSKLDLSGHIGSARIKDFSCSYSATVFLDSMKRIFTFSELPRRETPFCWNASALANPLVTASARKFHIIDTLSGRLFNVEFRGKVVEQQADPNCCQMLDNPHYQVTSFASGSSINMILLRSTSTSRVDYFMTNLRNLVSHSTLSDIVFAFE